MCVVWSKNYRLLGVSPVFLDFLQKMPEVSQQYLDQLGPGIHPSRQGPGTKAFNHYLMIVMFQQSLLKVTQDTLHLSLSSSPDIRPLESAPAPISSILLNPVTEAAAVLQLAGACQFVCEKDLAKGSMKQQQQQTQQTKSQNRQRGPVAQSSSRHAVPVTPSYGFEYSPPPTPPDHAAVPVRNGQVAVTAVAEMLGGLSEASTMIGAFGAPVRILASVVQVRYGSPYNPVEVAQLLFSQMSLASLEGLKLLLEVAALLAGMPGSLEQLVWLMQLTMELLLAAACGASFEQRQAFIADRGELLLKVLWRVGKAMSDESQQPVLSNPDVLALIPPELSHRAIISVMVDFLDALVHPCRTGSSFIAGKYMMHFMGMLCLQYSACGGARCALCAAIPAWLVPFPWLWVLSGLCTDNPMKLTCQNTNAATATGSESPHSSVRQCCHVVAVYRTIKLMGHCFADSYQCMVKGYK